MCTKRNRWMNMKTETCIVPSTADTLTETKAIIQSLLCPSAGIQEFLHTQLQCFRHCISMHATQCWCAVLLQWLQWMNEKKNIFFFHFRRLIGRTIHGQWNQVKWRSCEKQDEENKRISSRIEHKKCAIELQCVVKIKYKSVEKWTKTNETSRLALAARFCHARAHVSAKKKNTAAKKTHKYRYVAQLPIDYVEPIEFNERMWKRDETTDDQRFQIVFSAEVFEYVINLFQFLFQKRQYFKN